MDAQEPWIGRLDADDSQQRLSAVTHHPCDLRNKLTLIQRSKRALHVNQVKIVKSTVVHKAMEFGYGLFNFFPIPPRLSV
jgi:hypothetical protein